MRPLLALTIVLAACASTGGAVAPPGHDDARVESLPASHLDCPTTVGDCDNDPSNGCETDLTSDPLNCRACGHACAAADGGAMCIGGRCGRLQ